MKLTLVEKEWVRLLRKEQVFIEKHKQVKKSNLQNQLEKIVPAGLQDKLNLAFNKGFYIVFDKGVSIIEKTYTKDTYEQDYKINEYAANVRQSRKSLRVFKKKAQLANTKNKLISGVEGVVLGALGVGLPDIPLFIGVLLKSIYEIALSYGFQYDTEEEKIFILKLIETSMYYGPDYKSKDDEVNKMIDLLNHQVSLGEANFSNAVDAAANALSDELLYMKFLQGIPIAGIIGGLSDITCQHMVTEYALIKYQRRFLLNKLGR